MRRPKPAPNAALDLDAPVASLRRLAGLTQVSLAERRAIGQGSVSTAERAGDGVSIATLRAYAKAAGLELAITVRAAKEGGER